jgi:hypothetical protein
MKFKKALQLTFDKAPVESRNALWDYVDFVFDTAAKSSGILVGQQSVYETVEDFSRTLQIAPLPLYQYIFEERGGFLTQCKIARYYADEWNERFPNGPVQTSTNMDLLDKYSDFVSTLPDNPFHQQTRLWLDIYKRKLEKQQPS